MRLSQQEIETICAILRKADQQGRITLFGSRTEDARRGGDIDLYFEPQKTLDMKTTLHLEYLLQSALDMQVDLLVRNPQSPVQPIHEIAARGVVL